ncbi:MAG: LPS assembly protein LptD, partial [Marinospirillum sp.]|uniref:LPS-assembly protein LptD n=1 Tax=Marinospirillum sp. TaxID=2183934 RepID=UPI0019F26EC5
LNLNRESGFGDAYNVRMEIQQVPVFYWPWLRFPIDDRRHTGLLSPYISYSGSGRLDYQQPFYWNMAPNYDATFYPRYISDRGFMLGAEFRYLQPSDSGELYYAQLGGDELYYGLDRWHFAARHRGSLSRPASLNYSLDFSQVSDDRYFDSLGTNNLVGSDRELLQQFRMSYRQDVWQSRLTFKGYQQLHPSRDPNLSLSDPANAETPYKLFDLKQGRDAARQSYFQLPQLEVRGGSRLGDDTRWFLLADATHFTKLFDESVSSRYLTTSTPIPGQPDSYYVNSRNNWGAPDAWRLHLEPGLRTDWVWPWAFISPQVKLRHNQYWIDPYWQDATSQNQIKTVNLEPSYTVPVLSIDTGLYLERDTRILGHDLLQTLEPRLFAAYIPYVEQYEIPNFFDGGFADSGFNQMFRAERTTGRDRTGDVQKVTAGLTQRIISRYSGQEMASLGIAREFYAADRLLDNSYRHPDDPNRIDNQPREERPYTMVRPYSNLAIQAQWRISRDWQLRSNLLWDDHFSKTESANTYLAYTDMQGFRMNFGHSYSSNYLTHLRRVGGVGPKPESSLMDGYSYKRDAEEQVYASIIYPINDHWRVFAKQGHDWKRNEKLESLTGFEYNSCCWQLQLLYRDWVKNPDTSPGYNQATGFAARERDYGVFLQVVFKGLGGVGQGTRDLLSTEIQGYT